MKKRRGGGEEGDNPRAFISSFPSYSSRTPLCSTTIFHRVPALRRRSRGRGANRGRGGRLFINFNFPQFCLRPLPSHLHASTRATASLCVRVSAWWWEKEKGRGEGSNASRSINATRANYYRTRPCARESVKGREGGRVSK